MQTVAVPSSFGWQSRHLHPKKFHGPLDPLQRLPTLQVHAGSNQCQRKMENFDCLFDESSEQTIDANSYIEIAQYLSKQIKFVGIPKPKKPNRVIIAGAVSARGIRISITFTFHFDFIMINCINMIVGSQPMHSNRLCDGETQFASIDSISIT